MRRLVAAGAILISTLGAQAPSAGADPGGLGAKLSEEKLASAPQRARLVDGRAFAPISAPAPVRRAIEAANRISDTPYVWGGGHGRWWDRGYDCSGAVSYALRGAGALSRPLDSGSLTQWGEAGRGRWITVYANGGHAYAVIAGLRWDTSGGPGPRWHPDSRPAAGFVARHPSGL